MKEKVRYISLPKKFVAGTVIYGDMDECASRAQGNSKRQWRDHGD